MSDNDVPILERANPMKVTDYIAITGASVVGIAFWIGAITSIGPSEPFLLGLTTVMVFLYILSVSRAIFLAYGVTIIFGLNFGIWALGHIIAFILTLL